MLDYSIIAAYFKGAEEIRPTFTDFTDFSACFDVMQDSLRLRTGAYMSLNYLIEAEDPLDDHEVIVRYGFAGKEGRIVASILEEDGTLLNTGFLIAIDQKTAKLHLLPIGREPEEVVDDALKIIQDYGTLIVAGINWGAFLLHEHAEGGIPQYFEDAHNQEIH